MHPGLPRTIWYSLMCQLQSFPFGLIVGFQYVQERNLKTYRAQCGIIPLSQMLENIACALFAVSIEEYNTVIRNNTSIPCV